jgi:hypothetical protein
MATIGKQRKILFSENDIQFIKDNFQSMTNQQIADVLGLKKTIVRMKAYSLGLQRMTLEYWPKEAVEFLKDNYHKIGNREICRIFNTQYPKQKGWTPNHIDKKLEQLNLKRTKLDWYTIKERNRDNGSYGKRNLKNNPAPPKSYFYLNAKTRIEVKPGQSIEKLKLKYSNYDTTI